jgi:membrane-bound metal-dependent hydrolase YbcI (DUF457 family)
MPSPIGHALGGIAAVWRILPPRERIAHRWRAIGIVATIAAAPDFDLLVNDHRGPAHSLGAAVVAGTIALLWTRSPRWGLAAAFAWASHVLLDWLGTDTRPPVGVMALWPWTHFYYESPLHLFPAVSRRYWLAEFWVYNLEALFVELLLLLPLSLLVLRPAFRRKG